MDQAAQGQAVLAMLELQNSMNSKVHPQWQAQGFEWYRAIWIECGELMDHYGYKWWKKQEPDIEQVRLEIVDIWHFGMSALFGPESTPGSLQEAVNSGFREAPPVVDGVLEATEMLAGHSLTTRGFSVPRFHALMQAAEMDFADLYRRYVGKNVLNFFRQDHGYKSGSYVKIWAGREDNEHLSDILGELDSSDPAFAEQVYSALAALYPASAATA